MNALLLRKETSEAESNKKADFDASIINSGNNNKKLKIWNKGKATAKNIHLSCLEENCILSKKEIERIFPLESLKPSQSVELVVIIYIGMQIYKLPIQIICDDELQQDNEKVVQVIL